MKKVVDSLGVEIVPGQRVTYNKSGQMALGEIVKVTDSGIILIHCLKPVHKIYTYDYNREPRGMMEDKPGHISRINYGSNVLILTDEVIHANN